MTNRIKESDLVIPALRLMITKPEGFISTAELIQDLEEIFKPEGEDAQLLLNRNDTHFSQKVRNLVSHRTSPNNFIYKGYANYIEDREGLQITDQGRLLFQQIAA